MDQNVRKESRYVFKGLHSWMEHSRHCRNLMITSNGLNQWAFREDTRRVGLGSQITIQDCRDSSAVAKCLPCKNEELSSDSQHTRQKPGMTTPAFIPRIKEQKTMGGFLKVPGQPA